MNCADLSRTSPEVDRMLHDTRFWSNLRGLLYGETGAERAAAFGPLDCSEGMTVAAAWQEGWTRHGTAGMGLLGVFGVSGVLVFGALVFGARFRRQIKRLPAVRRSVR